MSKVKGEETCTLGLVSEESSNGMVVSLRGVLELRGGMKIAYLFFLV